MSDGSGLQAYCGISATAANLPIWREAFWGAEWARLRLSPLYQGAEIAKAEPDPVVLVPGFLASDTSLLEMHGWLERIGYDAYTGGFDRNNDCPDVLLAKLIEKIESVSEKTRYRVRLIGHSLGGTLARAAAVRRPELIAQVITLGSPINGLRIHPLLLGLSRLLERATPSPNEVPRPHGDHFHDGGCSCAVTDALTAPFPASVARTSIYSRTDGLVDWKSSVDTPPGVNIEVSATHIGLLFNPQVYRQIAESLAGVTVAPETAAVA